MPQHIALSFLGLGPRDGYATTTYVFDGDSTRKEPFSTDLMPHAISEVLAPDQLIVAGTTESNEKYRETLEARCDFTSITVPSGHEEGEWWKIFETITDVIPEGAHLTIDITHGFRSLPVIALSVALYLEVARDVTVKGIIYGSYRGSKKDSLVLNLTPFLDLIEWSVAARQFLRDGSAKQLARLLEDAQNDAYRTDADIKPKHASRTGSQLEALTDAFAVVRPQEIAEDRAAGLVETLDDLQSDVARMPELRPLSLLLEQIQERIAPMQSPSLFNNQGFAAQVEMMRFFLQTQQLQQAVTLAREALVSHQALQMGLDPEPVPRSEWEGSGRQQAEHHLGALADQHESRSDGEKVLGDLWHQLSTFRNDMNHAGMNAQPLEGVTLASKTATVVENTIDYLDDHPV